MPDLKYRQKKIQEKRKNTPWREFVMEIGSRVGMTYYRDHGNIRVYPVSDRMRNIVSAEQFAKERDNLPFIEYHRYQGFFEQYLSLQQQVPLPALNHVGNTENVKFAEGIINSKNVYLTNTVVSNCENILYGLNIKDNCRNVISSVNVYNNCDNIFDSYNITNSSNVFYSKSIHNGYSNWFCNNMIGCTECIGCSNLENVSYYIENKQYTKKEYLQKKQQVLSNIPKYQNTHFQVEKPYIINSTHCTGNDIVNCHNVNNIYGSLNVKGGNNVIYVGSQEENENFFDVFMAGRSDNFYGVARAGTYSSHGYCSYHFHKSQNLYYCAELESCSYCLGCIGLRNKSFCIFNKQYTKEEWHQKVDEIFATMEKEGTLGDFFPGRMNPYYFNDTVAYLIDPSFTKEEVEAAGYMRRDEPIKVDIPEGVQTVKTSELGQFESFDENGNWTLSDEILKKVIIDEAGNAYRVIPMELDFLRKYGLPLPRKHWLERLKGHFKVK